MPLSDVQKAALNRLQSFYEGDNPYNSVTNPGGFRQNGHLYNFVPALKDIATVITGVAALAVEVATNSAQSPKAVRVDGAQTYTQAEKARGRLNLGAGGQLVGLSANTTLGVQNLNTDVYLGSSGITVKVPAMAVTVNDDKIHFTNITNGLSTISRANNDTSNFYYNGVATSTIPLGPGQSLTITSDGGNWIAGDRAPAPEWSLDPFNIRTFDYAMRSNMRRSLKLEASIYTYVTGNLSLTGADVGTVFYTDAARTIQLPLLSECATGDSMEFYVYAGMLTLSQPAGNANPIGLPGSSGATVALTAGAYTVKKHDSIWRVYTSGVSKTGDTMTGLLTAPSFGLTKGNPSSGIAINSRDASGRDFLFYNVGDLLRIWEAATGDLWRLALDGSLWTLQLGDLNQRIEARAKAFADVAQGQAQLLSVAKTGDVMTGPLREKYANPNFNLEQVGGASDGNNWAYLHFSPDGRLYFQHTPKGGSTANAVHFGPDGSITTAQLGDLNARIEARGAAYSQAAKDTSVQKNNTGRQDINGGLAVSGFLDIVVGNVLRARWVVNGNGYTILQNGDSGDNFFYVTTGGLIWTKQLGDLNSRIEARASAFATNAQNAATAEAQYRFHAARMVFVGDLNQNSNPGGMTSPYGGNAVVTDRWTYDQGLGSYIDYAKRFRQPQFLSSAQGWVAITLA